MAAALVGGAFLSASLQVLFDRLTSRELLDFFRTKKDDDKLLKKLELTLLELNAVLTDAEYKQITNSAVKGWMDELKDAVYHADNLFDEIATQARKCKLLEAQAQAQAQRHPVGSDGPSQVISSLTSNIAFDADQIEYRIKQTIEKLEYFAKQKDVLGLTEGGDAARMSLHSYGGYRIPSTSMVDESGVYGRDPDKEKIIGLLLSNDDDNNKVGVIPIVGMGGIGKTTLAKLVYNDERVNQYFDRKAWVCVSDVFDALNITKTILEAVTHENYTTNDLSRLQEKLSDSLSGKRFFIVLDDVWNENSGDWDTLRAPFVAGKQGSKIIVTTRNLGVAGIMQTVAPFNLG